MRKGWLNVYPKRKTDKGKLPAQAGGLHATKEQADKVAKPHRIAFIPPPEIREEEITQQERADALFDLTLSPPHTERFEGEDWLLVKVEIQMKQEGLIGKARWRKVMKP